MRHSVIDSHSVGICCLCVLVVALVVADIVILAECNVFEVFTNNVIS